MQELRGKATYRQENLFFSGIVLVGLLDWATTITGIVFCGATEANPFISGLTKSSLILFSAVKLLAVAFVGLAFYKASSICQLAKQGWHFTKRLLYAGFIITFVALAAVVTSNMLSIFRF